MDLEFASKVGNQLRMGKSLGNTNQVVSVSVPAP
jgi:hypothetical protein